MNTFTAWWTSLSWCQALGILCTMFVVTLFFVGVLIWYFDPLKVETRHIRRVRRRERKLIAQTRAMLLKRHDSAADRDCFRWSP